MLTTYKKTDFSYKQTSVSLSLSESKKELGPQMNKPTPISKNGK